MTALPVTSAGSGAAPEAFLDALLDLRLDQVPEPAIAVEQRNAMYEHVWQEIQAGRYDCAVEEAFHLAGSEPWERDYLLALACCLHHLGQFEPAAQIYGMALLLHASDSLCVYRIGECLGALEHWVEAREAFETAIDLAQLDPESRDVAIQAQERLDELTQLGC